MRWRQKDNEKREREKRIREMGNPGDMSMTIEREK